MTATTVPGSPGSNEAVLDAALELLELRRRALQRMSKGEAPCGAQVVASGGGLNSWLMRDSRTWQRVLSTRPTTPSWELRRSMPNNRIVLARGLRMTSVFDVEGTEDGARRLLVAEAESQPDTYFFGCVPLRMRLVNDTRVYIGGEPDSILSLTHPAAVAAAMKYWRAVMDTAVPCGVSRPAAAFLTGRQQLIVESLIDGRTDEEVARALGRSVRTVRADVAAAMAALGVSSRAALGFAYAKVAHRSHAEG